MFTPMLRCYTPCINYHEVHDKSKQPSVKIICDYKDGVEIRNLSKEEINNCIHFKTFKEIRESNKKFCQIKP